MGAISDRDKKIIYFMLIIMVICLPYFFFIKNKRAETEAVNNEVISLQARYEELNAMDEKRDWYIEETENLNNKRDAIIAGFPVDIEQADYTMFLLQTENSSDLVENEDTGLMELEHGIRFNSVSYGVNGETAISAEGTDTGFTGLTNASGITYICSDYDSLKYLLAYFRDYVDPMIYTDISMTFDPATGSIEGDFTLAQYAITGADRGTLGPVDYNINIGGENYDFGLDSNNLRGNVEDGVFGPVELTAEELEEMEAADGEEAGEEAAEEAAEEE